MTPQKIGNVLNWASDIDYNTIDQATRTARLPIVAGHVALMPDAHVGMGATVGSVIPTRGAVIPSAVGVDIGCGMVALETDLTASQLPDDLDRFMPLVERAVPAGVGQGNATVTARVDRWLGTNAPASKLDQKLASTAATQLGSLGSGNHFAEVCLDERDHVWIVLHSGSRGIGNKLASAHIKVAKMLAKANLVKLEDPDLAYLLEGTEEFDAYIADMLWAQDYAMENRAIMIDRLEHEFYRYVGHGTTVSVINCHHNFTQQEWWPDDRGNNVSLWITRKGAIKAGTGDRGVIPGSMGTRSYIVSGLGNPASWDSCSHGAGRRMSRSAAKKQFTVAELAAQMEGKVWLADKAAALLDEIPSSYKDIDAVMADQTDLVSTDHTLRQILNYKGA